MDGYDGTIPANVIIDEEASLETTYSFPHYRSQAAEGVRIRRGATVYMGTMFDVGPVGKVSLGEYTLVHGAWIICDAAVEIGDYALISWNVVLMDTYRASKDRRPAAQSSGIYPAIRHAGRSLKPTQNLFASVGMFGLVSSAD